MEALVGLGVMAWFLLCIAFLLLPLIAMWRIFSKAGQPGWAILIPIYNLIVMLRVAGKPGWWFFMFLIPLVNIIFIIMMIHGISKRFGQGGIFTLGMIFFPFIFQLILAFGNFKYEAIEE